MFLLLSKLEGEKQADLAEWGLIDELCEYLLEEMVKLIEDNLPQIFNMEPIKDDDQVIQDAGEIVEDNSEVDDFDQNFGPGILSMPPSYFRGSKSFKVPPNMKRSNESDAEYKTRVSKWLLQITDHEFTQLSMLIDQEVEGEMEFAKLYNEAMNRRVEIKQGKKPTSCNCDIL